MSLPPFDAFLEREKPQSLLSVFRSRHFALQGDDPNNPFGHEPELAHLLDLLMPDEGTFLDVGANGGYFSVYLSIRPNFHGSIHAFEPVAGTFAWMRENIRTFAPGKNIVSHQVAASDKVGEATIDVNANSGLSSIKEKAEHGETIKTIALDSLNLDRVDFMKVDVEGHEANALRGAEGIIRSQTPYIFMESTLVGEKISEAFEPLQFLLDRGYLLYLPAWLQPNGSLAVGIGPDFERKHLALIPFILEDRLTFPGEAINIFACPKSRKGKIGRPFSVGTEPAPDPVRKSFWSVMEALFKGSAEK